MKPRKFLGSYITGRCSRRTMYPSSNNKDGRTEVSLKHSSFTEFILLWHSIQRQECHLTRKFRWRKVSYNGTDTKPAPSSIFLVFSISLTSVLDALLTSIFSTYLFRFKFPWGKVLIENVGPVIPKDKMNYTAGTAQLKRSICFIAILCQTVSYYAYTVSR